MSKSKGSGASELPLFDLPLHANDEREEAEEQIDLPLAEEEGEAAEPIRYPRPVAAKGTGAVETKTASEAAEAEGIFGEERTGPAGAVNEGAENASERRSPLRDHLASGFIDFGIQLLFLGIAVGSVHAMGIQIGLDQWPPFLVLELVFSFLYWFIPLAFWGQTPGMAWVGNVAIGKTGEPLTFGQTALRWCGALLTLLFAGLPILLVLTGGSLSDRLSESRTVVI